jgi:hypothetical protein
MNNINFNNLNKQFEILRSNTIFNNLPIMKNINLSILNKQFEILRSNTILNNLNLNHKPKENLTNTTDQKLIQEITSYKDNTMVTEFNTKLDGLESSYKEKLDKLNTDYETKFEDLNSKIAALLPSALMANLSSTYKQAKSNYQSSNLLLTKDETSGNYQYKPLSYKKGTRTTFIFNKFNSFLIKSIRYFVFLAPLIFIICINLGIKFGTNINLNLADIKTANDVLLRLFFNVPLGIISFYGYNMIRNNNNMLEEYHHKENVISLYEGLIKQLKTQKEEQISKKEETTSTDELINKLHDLIINTVANNPNSKTKNSTIWENTLNIISNNILKEIMNKVKNNHPKTP